MTNEWYQFMSLDLPPLLTAVAAAMTCALLGSFLLLRRMSLMGDAISHSVLPGIVGAFLLVGSRSSLPVFLGAAVAGVLCAVLVETTRRLGRVESGAAMGVIFSIFFATGVILIEQAAARNVDLDAECLLHGQLEHIFWSPPRDWSSFFSTTTLWLLPSEVFTSLAVLLVSTLLVLLFYKELQLSTFDPGLAAALSFSPQRLHLGLMVLVACAVVASFEAVGSILVIAMLICPAATARLLTDRLVTQLSLAMLIAAMVAIVGYLLGAFAPSWSPLPASVNAAGMIASTSGAVLALAVILAPRYGILGRILRQWELGIRVAGEDLLADLYRAGEAATPLPTVSARSSGSLHRLQTFLSVRRLRAAQLVVDGENGLSLTPSGAQSAKEVVRSHRLWESYLVEELGASPQGVHPQAEVLEHVTTHEIQSQLAERGRAADPHGRKIPE